MSNERIKNEINQVKELGEKIGFGHMMALASALWREEMTKRNWPVSGAFIPTCYDFLRTDDEEIATITNNEITHYDSIIKNNK